MVKDAPEIQSNPLITKLWQASQTDSISQFTGYLDASEDGVVRVFDDLSFESYVELRSADVIEAMEIRGEGVNRHRIFVAGSAHVRRVTSVSSRADAPCGSRSPSPWSGPPGGFARRARGFARRPGRFARRPGGFPCPPSNVVYQYNDQGYYQDQRANLTRVQGALDCMQMVSDAIGGITDTIEIVEGINVDGRFDGLVADLFDQMNAWSEMMAMC